MISKYLMGFTCSRLTSSSSSLSSTTFTHHQHHHHHHLEHHFWVFMELHSKNITCPLSHGWMNARMVVSGTRLHPHMSRVTKLSSDVTNTLSINRTEPNWTTPSLLTKRTNTSHNFSLKYH